MKTPLLLVLLLSLLKLSAQNIDFEDPIFKEAMVKIADKNGDNEVDQIEALDIKHLNISSKGIKNLNGINHFLNLETLDCSRNMLFTIDLSNNHKLKKLVCVWAYLLEIDVTNNTALTELHCGGNMIKTLDLSNNNELKSLRCGTNELKSLDLSNNKKLETIWCDKNQLTSLDVSHNTSLNDLNFEKNLLTYLNIKNNTSHSTRGLKKYLNPDLQTICADFHEVESIKSYSNLHPELIVSTCTEDSECEIIIDKFTKSFCPLFPKDNTVSRLTFDEREWYTDSTFNIPVEKNHPVENGKSYYSKKQFGCSVLITKTTVDIYQPTNYIPGTVKTTYCEKDKKTISDLQQEPILNYWSSNKIYMSKYGGEPLITSTLLKNNTTYYKEYDEPQYIGSECWIVGRTPMHVTFKDCSDLNVLDFEFNDQLTLYPNPVTDILNIQPKNGITIQSIEIYSLQGQLIKKTLNSKINVSDLLSGIYIVTIKTNKGYTTTKFTK